MINTKSNKHYDATHLVKVDIQDPDFCTALKRRNKTNDFEPLTDAELTEAEAALQTICGMSWWDFKTNGRFSYNDLSNGQGIAFSLTRNRRWLAKREGDILRMRGVLSKPVYLMPQKTPHKFLR